MAKKYTITTSELAYVINTYTVIAKDEEEAIELILDGNADSIETDLFDSFDTREDILETVDVINIEDL